MSRLAQSCGLGRSCEAARVRGARVGKFFTPVPSGSIPTRPLRRRGRAQMAKHGCVCDCKPPAHTSAMSKCNCH